MRIIAIAMMLATAPAFGQGSGVAGSGTAPLPAKPATAAPAHGAKPAAAAPAKPATASSPESRSAAALALSPEAAWLLKDIPQWSRASIDAAIATGKRQDIHLQKKVPVAWIYLTAWMTKDQTIHFRNDIYDQDEQLLEATAEEAAFFNQAGNHSLAAHLVRSD